MKLYILYTGGTIGCVGNPLSPLQGEAFVQAFQSNVESIITSQIAEIQISYAWFEHTLDSTDMQPSGWIQMAEKIADNYDEYDAFMILHGTDTMAYTASALSFLLPGITKPVIVTGSQLPLFYQDKDDYELLYNTDALRNVLGSITFCTFSVPEICLYFADHLYRGNRAVKYDASDFSAFSSPNYPPLGKYAIQPELESALLLYRSHAESIDLPQVKRNLQTVQENIMNSGVLPFSIFPAFYDSAQNQSFLVSILQNIMKSTPGITGLVLESYGEGNVPDFSQMQDLLRNIHRQGVVIVDCTQVYKGKVDYNAYATGAWLKDCGVISGHDMTAIAAFCKLTVLKALYPDETQERIEDLMLRDLAGELKPYYRISGMNNEFLTSGESLSSANGRYEFVNETGGSLILYDLSAESGSKVLWQKNIGKPGRLIMQGDCNLVFYSNAYEPLYASDTAMPGHNAVFEVSDDGKLCIVDIESRTIIKSWP